MKNAYRERQQKQFGLVKQMAETMRLQRHGRKVNRRVNGHQFGRIVGDLMGDPDMRARMIANRSIREALKFTSGCSIDLAHTPRNNKRRIFSDAS